ncbi:MAG: hypothetical protein K8S18_02520 [Desulfobacula sp.]|nr:hypothetical protein [Desulfobacula sp.]
MSLINEYLQKTIPQSREDGEVLVPPILRRKNRKALFGNPRFVKPLVKLLPKSIVLFIVFFFTSYIFYESFNYLIGVHKTDLSDINTKSVETVAAADLLKEPSEQKPESKSRKEPGTEKPAHIE